MGWILICMDPDPDVLPGSGSRTRKIQSWIRIWNKSFRIGIHNTGSYTVHHIILFASLSFCFVVIFKLFLNGPSSIWVSTRNLFNPNPQVLSKIFFSSIVWPTLREKIQLKIFKIITKINVVSTGCRNYFLIQSPLQKIKLILKL